MRRKDSRKQRKKRAGKKIMGDKRAGRVAGTSEIPAGDGFSKIPFYILTADHQAQYY